MLKPSQFPSLYNEPQHYKPVSTEEVYPISLDFIGLGAPKSGTTWVGRQLQKHPEVVMSGEAPFFTLPAHSCGLWNKHKVFRCYQKIAAEKNKKTIWGNYNSNYLYSGYALNYFHKHFADKKFYIVLRNPIERAVSQYLHMTLLSWKIPLEKSFSDSLLNDTWAYHILEWGFYDVYLSKWLQYFDKEQFLVLLYEDIKDNPKKVFSQLKKFLGLELNFSLEISQKKVTPTRIKGIYISDEMLTYIESTYASTRTFFERFLDRDLSNLWIKNVSKARHKGKLTKEKAMLARGMLAYDQGYFKMAEKLFTELYKRKVPHPYIYEKLAEMLVLRDCRMEAKIVMATGRKVVDDKITQKIWD